MKGDCLSTGDVLSVVRSPMSFRLLWPKIRRFKSSSRSKLTVCICCMLENKTAMLASEINVFLISESATRKFSMYLEIKVSKLLTNVAYVSMSYCSTRESFSKVSFVAGGGFGPIVSVPQEHWYAP